MPADETHDEVIEHGRSRRTVGFVAAVAGAAALLVLPSVADRSDPEPPAGSDAAAAPPSTIADEPDPEFTLLGSADQPGRTVTFVRVPRLRNGTGSSVLYTLADGDLIERQADRELTSIGRLGIYYDQPGERREYLLATEFGTVVTASGTAELFPTDADADVVSLGEGFAALPGPGPDTVWLFTSGERDVRLVDLQSGAEIRSVDLTELGRIVDAVGDRLIARPIDPVDDFGLWTPNGEAQLAGTAGTAYVGGAGDVAVFADASQFHVIDLDAPTEAPRSIPNDGVRVYRTMVSPDGSLIAASVVTPITEPNPIIVIDLQTGEVVHRIDEAIEALFQWTSPSHVMFLRPDWPAVDLVERDLATGVDANLVGLRDLTWWYTATERTSG